MKKKLDVHELRPGMYVCQLDRPWTETSFLFQGFEIRSREELIELARLCKYVYIETDPALRPDRGSTRADARPVSVAVKEHERFTDERPALTVLDKFLAPGPTAAPCYPDHASVEEELPRARGIVREAKRVLDAIFRDARLGRSVDSEGARSAVRGMVQSVLRNPDAAVWLSQLKNKDDYTAEHCLRVCVLALTFGRHLELSEPELNTLGLGALLHDIGKMKVPLEILNKPGRLTPEEFEIVKQHVPRGVEMLAATPKIPAAAIDVALLHHERLDGSGYASGMRGERIALFGQIGGIVDVYDAITSDRPYHRAISAHEALRAMYEWRGEKFHAGLVEQFIQCMGVYPIGSIVELSDGAIGVVISVNRTRRLRPRLALVLDPAHQPYLPTRHVDLIQHETRGPNARNIRRVLPAGSFGINALLYLPLAREG